MEIRIRILYFTGDTWIDQGHICEAILTCMHIIFFKTERNKKKKQQQKLNNSPVAHFASLLIYYYTPTQYFKIKLKNTFEKDHILLKNGYKYYSWGPVK